LLLAFVAAILTIASTKADAAKKTLDFFIIIVAF
jgi:hypothetical protein